MTQSTKRSTTSQQPNEGDHWGDDDVPTVSEVIGEGDEAHRIVQVSRCTFWAPVNLAIGDLLMRDTDFAVKLGHTRPRNIRKTIVAWEAEIGPIYGRSSRERTSMPNGGTRETLVREYWLTEAQALFIAAKSDTENATAILNDMIRVYMRARKGLLPQQQPSQAGAAFAAGLERMAVAIERFGTIVASANDRLDRIEARVTAMESSPALSMEPVLGRAQAKRYVLGALVRAATMRADAIGKKGDAKVISSIRTGLETDLRERLNFPRRKGAAWQNFPTARKGEACTAVARVVGEEEGLAKLAGKGVQTTFPDNVVPMRPSRAKDGA